MRVHILGICGTFMGGIALLARERGDVVSGSDRGVYPPMSSQLEAAGIELTEGYDAEQLDAQHDAVLVGNALTRGNPCIERLLDEKRELVSGPAWLEQHVLRPRTVLAVAGTHGKTTTASMLAWILDSAGLEPGFLIGGVSRNFGVSARLGRGELFVVEADEYDTAFFDKRSKLVHYRAHVLVINNLEYDHADIFRDVADIRRQLHHAVRLVPRRGIVLARDRDPELDRLLEMGCHSRLERFGEGGRPWSLRPMSSDASRFEVLRDDRPVAEVHYECIGLHNATNALAAIAAASAVGVGVEEAASALARFKSPRRRLERIAVVNAIHVYDDFAHHPSAIRATIDALRAHVGSAPIVAVLDPASNTMRLGVHQDSLAPALSGADRVLLHRAEASALDLDRVAAEIGARASVHDGIETIVDELMRELRGETHVLIMSNGAFGSIHGKLTQALARR